MYNPSISVSLIIVSRKSQQFSAILRFGIIPALREWKRFAQLFREGTCNYRLTQTLHRHRRLSYESRIV